MKDGGAVAGHYGYDSLLPRLTEAIAEAGLRLPLNPDSLSTTDSLHFGGATTTAHLMQSLRITGGQDVLDVGCGVGGPARQIAKETGAQVTGIDLTPAYVEAGRALCGMCFMLGWVKIIGGDALEMPFADGRFDTAIMMDTGVNIEDKPALMREVARVLKRGGRFGIFDLMVTGEGEPQFPLPWASDARQSALARPETYGAALEAAGFAVEQVQDRSAFAVEYIEKAIARCNSYGPGALGQHVVMGPQTGKRLGNMADAVIAGKIAPVQMIARRL